MAKKTAEKPLNITSVKASVFKTKCLDLMDEVQDRHIHVIVTKHGTPVAKLTPVDDSPPNPIGYLRGTLVSDDAAVGPEHDAWKSFESDPL